jgi:hypothetical protein
MPYPDTILTRPIRRAIMGVLILMFFIISPSIILYTMGYRLDLDEKRIRQTGVLNIDIEPEDAKVTLNDILLKEKMPLELTNRAPGAYDLRIEREGYHTWEKKVEIVSGQTTNIVKTALVKDTLPEKADDQFSSAILDVKYSFDGSHALVLTQTDSTFVVSLQDTETGLLKTTFSSAGTSQPLVDWSPHTSTGLIEFITLAGIRRIVIFDANDQKNNRQYTLSRPLGNAYQWIGGRKDGIAAQEGTNIFAYTESGKELLVDKQISPSFTDSEKNVWTFDRKTQAIQKNRETISTLDLSGTVLNLFFVNDTYALLRTTRGFLVAHLDTRAVTPIEATNKFYNTDMQEWLLWSPWEVWSVSKEGKATLLTRVGSPLREIHPIDNFGSILLVQRNNVFTIFDTEYNLKYDVFKNGIIKHVGINKKERTIFFLGSVGNLHGLFDLEY